MHTHAHTYVSTRRYVHTRVHAHTHVNTRKCTHVRTCTHPRECEEMGAHTCIHVHIHPCAQGPLSPVRPC